MLLLASWLLRLSTLYLSLRIPPPLPNLIYLTFQNTNRTGHFSPPLHLLLHQDQSAVISPCLDLPTSFHPSPRSLSMQSSLQNPGGSVSIRNHQWRLRSLGNSLADSRPPLTRGKQTFTSEKNSVEIISRDESQQEADSTHLLLWYSEKAGLSPWFQVPSKTYASVHSGGN